MQWKWTRISCGSGFQTYCQRSYSEFRGPIKFLYSRPRIVGHSIFQLNLPVKQAWPFISRALSLNTKERITQNLQVKVAKEFYCNYILGVLFHFFLHLHFRFRTQRWLLVSLTINKLSKLNSYVFFFWRITLIAAEGIIWRFIGASWLWSRHFGGWSGCTDRSYWKTGGINSSHYKIKGNYHLW